MRKRVLKLFLVMAVMFVFSTMFGKTTVSAASDVFANSIYVGGVKLNKAEYLESGKNVAVSSFDDVDTSNGYVYYSGNELMICDYTYEGAGTNPNAIFDNNIPLIGAIKNEGTTQTTLEIVLIGKNSLTHTSTNDLNNLLGIYVDGSLKISGSGILNINSPQGIYVTNDLNIKYGKTNIYYGEFSAESKFADVGIFAGDIFYMNGGAINVYTNTRVIADSIDINVGSILVSSTDSQGALSVAPDFSDYENLKLTVAKNADGSSRVFTYNATNIRQYKYFSIQASKTAISSIDVNSFTDPAVNSKASDLGDVELADDANYSCEDVYIEKKVDDSWVELDSDYKLRYNEDYRVVMYIVPNTGYTFVTDGTLSVTIPDKEGAVYLLDEFADYYCAAVGYEFIYETDDKEVTSFSVNLELPKIGQVYGDLEYSSDDITCSEGFSYSSFQIYEGTTPLEETKALERDIKYTIVLGFELANGYYSFDIEAATINGSVPTNYQFDGNILVLSYEFKITTTPIESIDVTQVKTPNAGEKISNIDTTRFLLGEGYELAEVKYVFEEEECSADTIIEYDKEYSYIFIFKAKEGYELTSSTAAKINGVAATYNYDESNNTIQVKYIFNYELTPIDAVYINGVEFPEVGDKVVDVDLSSARYDNSKYELHKVVYSIDFSDDEVTEDTILQYDITYQYTFVFVAKEGYKFQNRNALVNGFTASSWFGTYEGDETVYFEAYYYYIIESDNKEITEIEIYNYDIPNVGQKLSDVENTNDTLVFGGEYKIVDQNLGIYDIDLDDTVDYNGEIQRGPEYCIHLLLEAKEGYKFSLYMEYNAVIINSDRAVCYEVVKDGKRYMSVLYWFYYPEVSEEIEINSIEISNVDIPKVGQTLLDTTNTPDTIIWGEGYEIENLIPFIVVDGELDSRIPTDYVIDYNEEYAFVFELEVKEGYIFSLIEKATVNNDYAVILGMIEDEVLAIGYFFSYKTYDIYVADKDEEGNTIGVQVSDMNKDDVLGDGTVSYDPKTNTLTLNNYTYEGEGFDVDGGYVAIQLDLYENDVTIILKGENVINITGEYTSGILAFGDYNLNIEGDGSLEINSTMHGIGFEGEFGTITINGPEIVINSEGAMTTGIWAPNFVMKAGSLKIDSITLGIIVISESSKIDINGGSIEISVSVAGNTIAYMDGTMTFVPTLANLEEYALTYKVIGGTKSDGSNADIFDEELINAYKYFKISHVCNLEIIEQVNPTCLDAGKNAYYICDECGKAYEDSAATIEITDLASWGVISALGHDYAEATCTAPKTCKRDNCNATEGAALGHDYAEATCTEPKTCKVCSATEGAALGHDYAEATCTTPKTCKVCSATDGNALGHSFNDTWLNDDAKHWKECACTEKGYAAAHVDTNSDNKCDVCSYDMTVPHTHEFNDTWLNDDVKHWKECACTEKKDAAAHVDANSDNKCDVCSYDMTVPHTHEFNDSWKKDENNHWKECACTEKKDSAAHTDTNNDGKCDTCNYVIKAESTTPSKKGMSGGAVAAIVISSVAVAGVSGFAIFWFAIKKKTFADLIAVFIKK